jgi:hypothetical protein
MCHVDPAGGGMRNASGRFYGQATLPMIATSPRPTQDWDKGPFGFPRKDRHTTYSHNLPLGPNDLAHVPAYMDSIDDKLAWGIPYGETPAYAFYQGRYGRLNADPVLRIGWDIRLAALVAGTLLRFPMQVDVPILFHPVRHLSLFVNTGFRGRTSGYSDTLEDERTPYFREAFLLVNQAPYQMYLKAGRFVPSFGLRLDDHTSRIRRRLELDGALPEVRVTGVEVGAAPNYPFVNFSVFATPDRSQAPESFDIFDVGAGWGTALNLGYRQLGWSAGGGMLVKRRPLEEGGDMAAFGVYGAFNPWYYWQGARLTYQLELDSGSYQRASGLTADQLVFYQELDWLYANGVNLLVAYDWADPDREVKDDESHRLQAGGQWTPVAGVTVDGRVRVLIPALGGEDVDLFVQLHLWN